MTRTGEGDKVAEPGVRTYEIETTHGAFRIDIPETYRVTFGPVVGARTNPKTGRTFQSDSVLRIWESDTKQRALFPDVVSFRDTSIPVQRRQVRKFGTNTWQLDDGTWVGHKADEVEKRWRPVDDLGDIQSGAGDESEEVMSF